ncbi:MAG: hypothetical protein BUE48_015640 [Thermomonospora sp. CIF 1]|nr:MAG: hypothetical protein BUE48_015640 [Thermomonospora sp. CIF 1]
MSDPTQGPATPQADRPTVSARALALLDEAAGRRLRLRYRAFPELYQELLAAHRLALAWRITGADASDVAITTDPAAQSDLTTNEAAAVIGITPSGVREAIRSGRLTASRRAGRYFVPATAVAEFMQRRAARM